VRSLPIITSSTIVTSTLASLPGPDPVPDPTAMLAFSAASAARSSFSSCSSPHAHTAMATSELATRHPTTRFIRIDDTARRGSPRVGTPPL